MFQTLILYIMYVQNSIKDFKFKFSILEEQEINWPANFIANLHGTM